MSFRRFLFLSTLSTLGISLVYAVVGWYASSESFFLLAFAASMILPGISMLVMKVLKRHDAAMVAGCAKQESS